MMKLVNNEELYSRLKKQAYNSSHYVWLWSDLKFLESSNGWIFGVTKELGVNLVALEPLPPLDKTSDEASLAIALEDLQSFFQGGTVAFVGINTPFAKTLANLGYASFQIGKEPWVNLSDIKPTGHAGRKVRVGRNQAIKSGLRVEEWKLTDVIKDKEKLATLNEVKQLWEDQSFVALSGFLHGMTFENIPEDRKCFVALTKENVVDGILITTPIAADKSWYFEDLLIRTTSEATKGIGELLTLSAMESLQQLGHEEVSLGIVPMTTVGVSEFGKEPPANFLKLTKFFQSTMGMFYNASGMELFRKRFKVVRWDKIYLSIKTDNKSKKSETIQWITVLLAITLAYKPSFQLKPSFIADQIMTPVRRYKTTFAFLFISIVSFLMISKVIDFSQFAQAKLEFSKDAPFWQWPLRTLSSELVYYSSTNFWLFVTMISAALVYIEGEVFNRKWATYLLGFFALSDIFARMAVGLVYNNIYHNESVVTLLNLFPTHGGAIILASMLGFATTLQGLKKDEWLAYGVLAFICLSFILPAFGIASLALLYCTSFYIEGYLVGKYYLYYQSQKDALISKSKNEDDDTEEVPVKSKKNPQTAGGGNKNPKHNQKPKESKESKDDLMDEDFPATSNS